MNTKVHTQRVSQHFLAGILTGSLLLAVAVPNVSAQQEARKERIARAAAAMTETTKDLETIKGGIASTSSALKRLSDTAKTDPKPAYQLFLKNLAKLEKDTAAARAKVVGMEARSQTLYEAWNAEVEEISNKDIRKAAEKRYNLARSKYEDILNAGEKAKDAFSPLLDNMRDIRTYLENELTERGIRQINGLIRRAGVDSATTIRLIDEVIARIDEVKTTLGSKEGF